MQGPNPLLVVDVQHCFLNDFTRHIPARIAALIERGDHDPVLFTRFVNVEDSPFRRMLAWEECLVPPGTELAEELRDHETDDNVYSKPGYAGLPESLAGVLVEAGCTQVALVGIDTDMCVLKVALDLFDLNIEPLIYTDCCASTAGLQAHFAGLAVLARNVGASRLLDAGLTGGNLAAPESD
jgi:nicotinamidase-related amidase